MVNLPHGHMIHCYPYKMGVNKLKWYKSNKDYWKRIYELEIAILQTDECKILDKKMDAISKEIKQSLPGEKQYLVNKIEDYFIEGLILYEEYFYKNGYIDSKVTLKNISIFKKLTSLLHNLKL